MPDSVKINAIEILSEKTLCLQGQTMDFEAEPEDVIVADVMPDQTQPPRDSGQYVTMSNTTYQTQNTTLVDTVRNSDPNVTYVPLRETLARADSPQLQTTSRVIQYEPVHVQAVGVSQTSRPTSSVRNDYTTAMPAAGSQQADVVVFGDSDDEAGFTPNRQEDVLF